MSTRPEDDAPPPLPPDLKSGRAENPWDNPPVGPASNPRTLRPAPRAPAPQAATSAGTPTPNAQRRHVAMVGAIVGLNLLIGIGVAVFFVRSSPEPPRPATPSVATVTDPNSSIPASTATSTSEPVRVSPPAHLDVPDHPAEQGKFVHWLQASDHDAERGKAIGQ